MIHDRWDHDHDSPIPDDRETWTQDRVICRRCRYVWVAVYAVIVDPAEFECPCCSATGAELKDEYNVAELTRQ